MYGGSDNAGNMWKENTNNNAIPMAPYLNVMQQIHVMLVDNDHKALFETGKMLEMCSYKVTFVDLASSAISMLSNNQDTRFDVIMLSTNSPDQQGYKLLQLAVSMSIPVVLLSVDEDAFFITRAIRDGAFLNIQKPVPMEVLKYLWQHIFREIHATSQINCEGFEMEGALEGNMMLNNVVLAADNNNDKGKQVVTEDGAVNLRTGNHHMVRRRSCAQWTDELHLKFIDAVETLGEGRCFPKEILQLMNVPGLTRMQVASHLQKCRNATWRLPEERNNKKLAIQSGSNSDSSPLPVKARRFGSMPKLTRPSSKRTAGGSSSHNHRTEQGEPGLVQDMMGSTVPVANNVDYGQLLVPPHQQQINNVDYGAGTDSQYLLNLPDDFFDFSDVNNLNQGFASMPQDSFGGFNHVPSSDNQNACNNEEGNYDQSNGTYFGGANASG